MKKLSVLIFTICLLVLCGCDTASNETINTTDATQTTTVELTTEEIYDKFLTKVCNKLDNIIVDDTHLDGFNTQKGMSGIAELAKTGDTELLKKYGYAIIDTNADGVDELLIYQVDDPAAEKCTGTYILCAYTAYENEAVLLFEGTSENRYYYLNDKKFYNETTAGEKAVYVLLADSITLDTETTVGDENSLIQKLELTSLDVFRNIKIAENS